MGGGGGLAVVSNCTTAVHVYLLEILSIPDITVQAVSLIKVHAIKKTDTLGTALQYFSSIYINLLLIITV